MQLLIYILVFPILWFLSILPFRLLYLISDFLYLILYYGIGYRKKVVYDNLKLALPNKSEKELLKIRRQFYVHFTDVFMEMIKSISISEKNVHERFVFEDVDVLRELGNKGRSIVLVGSHYANWEWMVSMNNLVDHEAYAVSTRIGNKYFDKMMLKYRTKYGGQFVTPRMARRTYEQNSKNGILALNALVSDQSPQLSKTHYWAPFLNVKVPVHVGAEQIAKKLDQSVVFYEVSKVRRGHYKCTFRVLAENPNEYPDYQITDMFLREVEKQVQKAPQYYFWTHKRFKHKDKFEEFLKQNLDYKF
ncbi:lysophospholipid acyltransferase family protein [Urechidicola vernalis]|uniref:Lysophospholipid acyltransferase family protein n=1 Tax=Urechidicola vernalis TaxID=3075600 RepID=A0ABU2Y2C1_9FLAO|nr:lysophospholipid acyltransferase family protein [Urechidicola sp. P050]MDT0551789.1 lysophospholipid acyltransferase family protein [Urechidicola sp. P050]